MELYEANRILRTVKSAIAADGYKLPSSAETDGLLMLLGKLKADKYLAPKIKHARAQDKSSAAYARSCKLIAFFRALQAVAEGLNGPVTSVALAMLNKTVMGDCCPDAGKLRTTDAATDGNAHTDPKYIAGSVKSIVAKMNEISSAPATAKDDFAGYLSHYMRELLILRPFDCGGDFTLRIFLIMFCKLKGFALAYYRVSPSTIKAAEKKAFACDDVTPVYAVFTECLTYDNAKPAQQRTDPPQQRTRREVAKDLTRPARPPAPPQPQPAPAEQNAEQTKKPKSEPSDDVIRRAIRLQQKISKLNEQLTELIKPLDGKDDEDR